MPVGTGALGLLAEDRVGTGGRVRLSRMQPDGTGGPAPRGGAKPEDREMTIRANQPGPTTDLVYSYGFALGADDSGAAPAGNVLPEQSRFRKLARNSIPGDSGWELQ